MATNYVERSYHLLSGDLVSSDDIKFLLAGVLYKCSYKSLNYLTTSRDTRKHSEVVNSIQQRL